MLRVQPVFNHDETTVSFKRPGFVSASAVNDKIGVALLGARITFPSIYILDVLNVLPLDHTEE